MVGPFAAPLNEIDLLKNDLLDNPTHFMGKVAVVVVHWQIPLSNEQVKGCTKKI